jgi:NifU-like protein involved in Fe-S cluster formation
MKGNINMVNEMLDNTKTREELKDNDIIIEMMKALKEEAPKLVQTIEEVMDEEDITNCCMIVNDDIQKTFSRFRAIKEN